MSDPAAFPLRHFWPLGLVAGAALLALALFIWPPSDDPPPVDVSLDRTALSDAPPASEAGAAENAVASLLVVSEPIGASISIDGMPAGTTPLLVENVRVGTRQVTLSREGFAPVDTAVAVAAGAALRVALRPTSASPAAASAPPPPPPAPPAPGAVAPAAPLEPGRLAVSVRPWGTIFVDGEVRRRDADVVFETALSPGVHRIRAVHPTLGEKERTVTVRSGETARLTIDLNTPSRR